MGELSPEQRTVLKEHGLAWVLFLTPEAQVRTLTCVYDQPQACNGETHLYG